MEQIIIHIDMDAFFASVEIRDNVSLAGKPLIIGALPTERGVVSTCSYEARKYGIHSGMSIKEAYRLCPTGVYMHGNMDKYRRVSQQIHEIWDEYADASEAVALDEAYIDVTNSAGSLDKAREFAKEIKRRIKEEVGLTCSVGIAYSKTAAKIASEEKKPNGYFEIISRADFVDLISDRDIKILPSVGKVTAERLHSLGIHKVKDIRDNPSAIISLLGKHGEWIVDAAFGVDNRVVTPYVPEETKSVSREITFQEDTDNYEFLRDVLALLAVSVEQKVERHGLHGNGVSIKITYPNMKTITRSKAMPNCESAIIIYKEAVKLLSSLEEKPIRLIGVGVYNLSDNEWRQMTLEDFLSESKEEREREMQEILSSIQVRYGVNLKGEESLYEIIEFMRKGGANSQERTAR